MFAYANTVNSHRGGLGGHPPAAKIEKMNNINKKIFNVFGIPDDTNITRGYQISPVILCNAACTRSGAWVFRNNNNTSNCATNCANNCANNARTNPGFRRALFASLIPNNKTTVLPNSAGLCNQTKYGQYQEGQNHRISFDTFRIMACSPSNCCGNV